MLEGEVKLSNVNKGVMIRKKYFGDICHYPDYFFRDLDVVQVK